VLKGRTKHYLYVSSVSAYSRAALEQAASATEQAATTPWVEGSDSYGLGKAESERRLSAVAGGPLTLVRPGPIKGARDNGTDLLTWLRRLQGGGRHIAPGDGTDPVELVDVKDVARFLVLAIDQNLYGTYNLTGRSMTFREFLERCKAAVRSNSELVWIPKAVLDEHQLPPDQVLNTFAGYFPLWRPPGALPNLFRISSDKAYRVGWQTRPFNETAFDCLSDFRAQDTSALATPALVPWSDRLSRDTELAVLDAGQHRER
jgi:2'-hydroxyisoflavone reductase